MSTLPRTTDIIKAAGLMDMRHFNDYSRDKGTAVHAACEFYDQGDLDEDSLDPVILPYLKAYEKFRRETSVEVVAIEVKITDESLGYIGRYDRLYLYQGHVHLTDIKSGAPMPWHAVQLAAYRNGAGAQYRRAGLYLNPPNYKFVPYTDRADFEIFKAALTIYQTRQAWNLS